MGVVVVAVVGVVVVVAGVVVAVVVGVLVGKYSWELRVGIVCPLETRHPCRYGLHPAIHSLPNNTHS